MIKNRRYLPQIRQLLEKGDLPANDQEKLILAYKILADGKVIEKASDLHNTLERYLGPLDAVMLSYPQLSAERSRVSKSKFKAAQIDHLLASKVVVDAPQIKLQGFINQSRSLLKELLELLDSLEKSL